MKTLTSSLVILAAAAPALAQPFSMQSFTIDSGGAIGAVAGTFRLDAVIGQPDAGVLSAGSFVCEGGFLNKGGSTTCYPNCDGSTGSPKLTGNDFTCFINAYATGQPYANCDGSTGNPLLTANDFTCFINSYAIGCT